MKLCQILDMLTFQSLPAALHTTRFNIKKFYIVLTLYVCFAWLSEQRVSFALYICNRLVFITEVESVYSAVRTESLYNTDTSRS
jgi:hypothetical protein